MFKKYRLIILITTLSIFIIPHFAHAGPIEFIDRTVFASFINTIGEFAKQLASVFLAFCAATMDVSLVLTMKIKQFVDGIPAIYTVWKAIRDISGIAIIFTLVWVALQMILDIKSPNFSNIIKQVVMAGFLINFSFFAAGLLIDVSNVVSLQIYKQMLPGVPDVEVLNANRGGNILEVVRTVFDEGGISSVFMNVFKFQRLDGQNVVKTSTNGVDATPVSVRILITSVAATVMMITTGLSFLIAAVAFISRLAILVFSLAFSPLYFVSFIIPQLKSKSSKLLSTFTNQLLFMPVYLLLMYLALQIVSNFNVYSASNSDSTIFGIVAVAANCVFVIIMLNVPLLAAFEFGAMAPNFMKNNFGADKVWKYFAGNTLGYGASQIFGRAASSLDKSLGNRKFFGTTTLGRDMRAATVGALAKQKFGSSRSYEESQKEKKTNTQKANEINRQKDFNYALARVKSDPTKISELKTAIGNLSEKQILSLGAKTLSDINVAKHLKGSHYEAIKKSTDDFSDQDKSDINKAREKALDDAIGSGQNDVIKHMIENYDGKDLLKLGGDRLKKPEVIMNLRDGQLRVLQDEGLAQDVKNEIYKQIMATASTPNKHRSYGFMVKNEQSWRG
jgi:hypothetical protein